MSWPKLVRYRYGRGFVRDVTDKRNTPLKSDDVTFHEQATKPTQCIFGWRLDHVKSLTIQYIGCFDSSDALSWCWKVLKSCLCLSVMQRRENSFSFIVLNTHTLFSVYFCETLVRWHQTGTDWDQNGHVIFTRILCFFHV